MVKPLHAPPTNLAVPRLHLHVAFAALTVEAFPRYLSHLVFAPVPVLQ